MPTKHQTQTLMPKNRKRAATRAKKELSTRPMAPEKPLATSGAIVKATPVESMPTLVDPGSKTAIPKELREAWEDRTFEQLMSVQHAGSGGLELLLRATTAAYQAIAPRDAVEGMLANQLIAAYEAAMERYRQAAHSPTFEMTEVNVNLAAKLSKTVIALMEALNKHRNQGHQKVVVEHVHVHSGGQAIVGNVQQGGGGGAEKIEGQSHGPGLAVAPSASLQSGVQALGRPLSGSSGEGQEGLPDPRGASGRANGRG